MAIEQGLGARALDPAAAPVDETDGLQSGLVRRADVFLNEGVHIGRREGVEVELGADGNAVGKCYLLYSATTVVVMPPRAVKAPVTRMRRGWHPPTRSSRILLVAAS